MLNNKVTIIKVPCPVCSTPFFDSEDFPGSYFICPKCDWEDDDVQYYDANFEGGANDVSLNQARVNYKLYGTSDPVRSVNKTGL